MGFWFTATHGHDLIWAVGLVVCGLWMCLSPFLFRRLQANPSSAPWIHRAQAPLKLKVATLSVGILWTLQVLLL